MNASEVKKGDRVVFETGGKEFNGIALSDAKVAVHPGVKKAGIYLDIAYLDGSGSLVKVLSAKVSKDAVSDGDLCNIVELEHAARSRDHRRSSLEAFGGDVTEDDLRKDFRESKQDSGWKPFADGEEVAALKEQLAAATVEVNDGKAAMDEVNKLTEERAGLESAVLGLQTQLESVTAERNGLKASIDDLTLERDTLKEQLGNMTAESSESASSGSPSPSAADLDAVAAEQEAAKATAADGESGAAASK